MGEHSAFDCREAFNRLDDFVDRELSAEEMELVRIHLELCSHCAEEFRYEESVLQQLRDKLAHIELPCDLMQKIGAALDRA